MSDEPDRQDLEDRVDQLEETISKMLPGRRDALKLGGAALVGGAAMSGSASAGTQQAGTIGTANDPVDVESEDINNADTITTDSLDANSVDIGDAEIDRVQYPLSPGVFTETTFLNDDDGSTYTQGVQTTDNVGTSNKEIFDSRDPTTDQRSCFCHVHGRDPNQGGRHFTDLLIFLPFGGVSVFDSLNRGGPPTRTYSVNGTKLELSLSDRTANVVVAAETMNANA